MVHSLRAAKAEGNKNGASSKPSTGELPVSSATTTATITSTTTNDNAVNTEGFGVDRLSLGSECLFSSTEELLDFSSEYFNNAKQSEDYQTTTCKAFSIDSDDYDDRKVFPSAAAASSTSENRQYYSSQQQPKACCWIWKARYWKAARWRLNAQTIGTLKMVLKRNYLIVLLLCSIIFSCLLASFVISRTLDSIGAEGDNVGDTSKQEQTALNLAQSRVPIEFEQRTIDLIDLIECGKTFAFTKLRVKVRVPKSSPIYKQQPEFLKADTSATSSNSANVGEQQQASEAKYVLTRLPDTDSLEIPETDKLAASADSGLANATSSESSTIEDEILPHLISTPIKPVASSDAIDEQPATNGGEQEDLRVLKRFKRPTRAIDHDLAGQQTDQPDQGVDLYDPLEGAASEMQLSTRSVNKTVIDCFIVDTDKRFKQKVAFEDRYRQVASTRKVSFKKMMDTIITCRRLTWANLLAAKKKNSQGAAQPVTAHVQPASQADASSREQGGDLVRLSEAGQPAALKAESDPVSGSDFFGNLFGSWLGSGDRHDAPPLAASLSSDNSQQVAEARQVASRVPPASADEQRRAEQRADGSYFNLGMSMVSGIVPNTLWCGLGDRAANYSELGAEFQVDACCRAHDHCPVRLKPFTTDYGLVNWSMSTRSHCDCDSDFNECLSALNSTLSNVIRILYFRFVGLQCIDVEGKQTT